MPQRVEAADGLARVPFEVTVLAGRELDAMIGCLPRLKVAESALNAWCRIVTSREIARGGYRIQIRDSQVAGVAPCTIIASDDAGARAALATLSQLVQQHRARIPCYDIEDAPTFATRGVMLDVSRCRVPTMRELFSVVDLLASLKFNHLQLYTEHTFAYANHEDVWRGWSPMTAAEIRRMDDYCQARGIELAANQNCFGHLAHWLKMPRYQHLAETHGDWVFDVWPRSGAFSVCPTDPASLEFVKGLLAELLPNFSSGLCNVGCDETFDVGWGRSKAEVEKRGRGSVYAEFVAKIATEARGLGKRSAFWADIALHDAASLKLLPKDMIALCWGYEPDSQFGQWVETCRDAELEAWVCPGTSSWCSITGRSLDAMQNIAKAAKEGFDAGATGFLLTDWGDRGHHQTWPIALNALAFAAQAAWGDAEKFDAAAASRFVLGDESGKLSQWIFDLGNVDQEMREECGQLTRPKDPRKRLLNQSAMFADMWKPLGEKTGIGELRLWEACREKIAGLAGSLPGGSMAMREELSHTVDCALWATDRAIVRRGAEVADSRRANLRERLDAIAQMHRRIWGFRSRPGGLEQSLEFYGKLRELL